MSGILAKSNFNTTINYRLFIEAANTLSNRGPDGSGYLFLENFALAHKRLIIRDRHKGQQPMCLLNKHLITDTQLINRTELKDLLKQDGYLLEGHSDAEILLRLLVEYDVKALELINGNFAFVLTDNENILAARDPFGVKPLYYSFINNDIIIASEIKAILKYKKEAIVDKEGLQELLGLGPSHSPGKTVFKGIYELKPGHYLRYSKNGLVVNKYYELKAVDLKLTKEEIIEKTKFLVKDTCYLQGESEIPISSFLSGGLDSSIVSLYLSENNEHLDTFSIDYVGNDAEYKPNKFETSNDKDFVPYVVQKGGFNQKYFKIDLNTLADSLKTAVILRDYPGMADIDASLFWFAKKVKKTHKIAFSGEGADEIFGGYPWFYRDDGQSTGFPWLRNLEFREDLLKEDLKEKLQLKTYVQNKYEEIIAGTPISDDDSLQRIKQRQISYITMKYFMITLLDRSDRMTSGAGLEVRMPFSDKRLVEFLYNVPWEYKYFNNTEKALLREACKDILPNEIYSRKKSPFPKTRSKKYEEIVSKLLSNSLQDNNSILYKLFDINKMNNLINSEDDLEVPWYGQLMRKPQLIAFLYQIDYWAKEYNIKLEI